MTADNNIWTHQLVNEVTVFVAAAMGSSLQFKWLILNNRNSYRLNSIACSVIEACDEYYNLIFAIKSVGW